MARKLILACLALLALMSLSLLGRELHVPAEYPMIQLAVNAARNGDTVVVASGVYFETVWITERRGLTLRGEGVDELLLETSCLEFVRDHPSGAILSGSIRIRSSERICIEYLTITGPGPGIHIEGDFQDPTVDVSVCLCNLVNNVGSGVELAGSFFRVGVSCSRIASVYGQASTGTDALRTRDIHLTCTLPTVDGEEDSPPPGKESMVDRPSSVAEPVIVAVIDSGIDRSIRALHCYLWHNWDEIDGNGIDDDGNGYVDDFHGWDFSDGDADVLIGTPIHWHGTFVAGVLADSFEALVWPTAVHPTMKIMDLRFLDSQGQFYRSDWARLAEAIEYAVANGADVINLSLYATQDPPPFVREAVLRAVEQGVLLVGIAGNSSSVLGPIAQWEEILTVGAVDKEGVHAPFSSIGPEVDLAAQGVGVLSLLPGGKQGFQSGTSFAAPHVAGVAAYHITRASDLSPADTEMMLRLEAIEAGEPGHDPETGWGIIE